MNGNADSRARLFSRKVETSIWKCNAVCTRELGVNKGGARRAKGARRLEYSRGWFRARRGESERDSFRMGIGRTLVWGARGTWRALVFWKLRWPHRRSICVKSSIRSHFLPFGRRNLTPSLTFRILRLSQPRALALRLSFFFIIRMSFGYMLFQIAARESWKQINKRAIWGSPIFHCTFISRHRFFHQFATDYSLTKNVEATLLFFSFFGITWRVKEFLQTGLLVTDE